MEDLEDDGIVFQYTDVLDKPTFRREQAGREAIPRFELMAVLLRLIPVHYIEVRLSPVCLK